MADVRLGPTNDRQVVGVMNEFAFQCEQFAPRTDEEMLSLSMTMSELILGPLMNRHSTPAAELAAHFGPDADVAVDAYGHYAVAASFLARLSAAQFHPLRHRSQR